jgi:hypothetical protein
MPTQVNVKHVRDADVDDAEKALVALLELALVEYLDGNNGRVLDVARGST